MNAAARRSRILCIRAHSNPDAAPLLRATVDEWIEALSLHCDVTVVEEDFDLAEVCARVEPDALVFEALQWARKPRLDIRNSDARPDLPRALILNCDPHDPMRPLVMDMVAAYGIDTIFCTGIEDLQQMHELRRFDCFVLPKFIDAAIYRDYGEARTIPLTIMGAHLFPTFYAWRAQVTAEIQQVMPALLYTHPGYNKACADPFAITGERFARMLSRSMFCIADTTVLDYVVRKHLEIPAAGSVLVSPDSAPLREHGFVDMENCILGPAGPELYARIVAVAADPMLYERIRSNGHALVHGRYTREKWTHIADWLACRIALKLGEKVQQDGVGGPFRPVVDGPGVPAIAGYVVYDNPMAARLRIARDALLGEGDLSRAVDALKEAMGWIGHIAEPWFMMAIIALAIGDLDQAPKWLAQRSAAQGRTDAALGLPDPCEIAWLLLVGHLTGDADLIAEMTDCAAATRHVAIRRMEWLVAGADPDVDRAATGLEGPLPGDVMSIHWLGDEDFDAWFGLVGRILPACTRTLERRVA